MSDKMHVGVLGSTGRVGEQYCTLLKDHPQFELVFEPSRHEILNFKEAEKCDLIFSALPSKVAKEVEPEYAKKGFPVFSCASCHRFEEDIPLIIPEINSHHLELISLQQQKRGWEGCLISKPNCTLQSYLLPLYPLHKRFKLKHLTVTNLQAISGAGTGYELSDNIIPYIAGEEEKSEREPQKILGESISISSHCLRVPVQQGHLSCVSAAFWEKPTLDEVRAVWDSFEGLNLPSAPSKPLVYFEESDRPQPHLDSFCGNGMSVAIGRLRECPLFDIRFVALSNNLIRGAAGGGILTAELYVKHYETSKNL